MHPSALNYCRRFFETYCEDATPIDIVEVGSLDVNGSLRTVAPPQCRYTGLDFAPGRGVDVVLNDPYSFPLPDQCADIVVTSSCFEHSDFFWLTFLESLRLLRPHGLLYLNAPSNGLYHRHPADNWRFYPDAGKALTAWARRNGNDVSMLESFIGWQEGGLWNDFVAVFLKDRSVATRFPKRVCMSLGNATNVYIDDSETPAHSTPLPQDMRRIRFLLDGMNALLRDVSKI